MKNNRTHLLPSSFRDPSGQLFTYEDTLFRQINKAYQAHYDHLMTSGLYDDLVNHDLLVPHEEVNVPGPFPDQAYRIIKPEPIPFISYPYEWSFSQLKDAAQATLKIQKKALDYGMILKDASAYNIQFYHHHPVLIDTLSFEIYREGSPWIAYKQFCQHFLAPLVLMSYVDVRLNSLLQIYIDGIPLDLTSKLLPLKSKARFSLLSHIHLHAKSQQRFAGGKTTDTRSENNLPKNNMSRFSLQGLIDNLETSVQKLSWELPNTTWSAYYEQETSDNYLENKKQLVKELLEKTPQEGLVWDIGANTGEFSHLAAQMDRQVISIDMDLTCTEKNYIMNQTDQTNDNKILPLCIDFTNPTPAIGWGNNERMSLIERGPAQVALALALVHHLAIGNNVPLEGLASFFHKICQYLIIEFVPKEDEQVQRLLSSREDIFLDYQQNAFEKAFKEYFKILESYPIADSGRILYLMEVRN